MLRKFKERGKSKLSELPNLPTDVLELIQHMLPISDQASFARVCKAWSKAGSRGRRPDRWEINFLRHFEQQYHILRSTKKDIRDWQFQFKKQEDEEYSHLSKSNRKLLRKIKDCNLKNLDMLAQQIERNTLIACDSNGFSIAYWAQRHRYYSWLNTIYQTKILPRYTVNGSLNPNSVDSNRRTLLQWAVELRQDNDHIAELLALTNSAAVNSHDCLGATALFIACQNGYIEAAELLLNATADVNLECTTGANGLFISCQLGHTAIVKLLLDRGAKMNSRYFNGHTDLSIACQHGHTAAVKLLLDRGADVNLQCQTGVTALAIASRHGHTTVIKILLDHDPDMNIQDSTGATALSIAMQNRHIEAVKLLLDHKANANLPNNMGKTALFIACQNGDAEAVELLLNANADVNSRSNTGATALSIACENGHTAVVKLLLAAGAKKSSKCCDGKTALFLACQNGHTEIAKLLLVARARINSRSNSGATALYVACFNGHTAAVELLINHGALMDLRHNTGETALNIAYYRGHIGAVCLLLNAGAVVSLSIDECATLLQIASNNNYDSIVKILITEALNKYIDENNKLIENTNKSASAHKNHDHLKFFKTSRGKIIQQVTIAVAAATLLKVLNGEESPEILSYHSLAFKIDNELHKLYQYSIKHHLLRKNSLSAA
ncbi:MAG: ankyrin repeat domain-containing protein [Gammaproteobacteria bacterium]|nr:ankyrin repeat domain-containing protein [Gammaproteobacteria bacterium]